MEVLSVLWNQGNQSLRLVDVKSAPANNLLVHLHSHSRPRTPAIRTAVQRLSKTIAFNTHCTRSQYVCMYVEVFMFAQQLTA